MQRRISCFLSVFFTLIGGFNAQQNLVPNWDMELTDCDIIAGSLQSVNDWYIPDGGGTTDYFNVCYSDNIPGLGVPQNVHGHQFPHSGEAYIGLATWAVDYVNVNELARVQLTEPLEGGVEYELSCFISLAEISSVATDKIHFHFSTNNYNVYLNAENDLVDQAQVVMNNLYDVDSSDWYFFQSSFIADGGEEYLTIGDMRLDSEIDTLWLGYNNSLEPWIIYAFYYVDDVVVKKKDVSIDEISASDLKVRFNSLHDELEIYSNLKNNARMDIYDTKGRRVLMTELKSTQASIISTTSLQTGLYFLQIEYGDKRKTIKIVKN